MAFSHYLLRRAFPAWVAGASASRRREPRRAAPVLDSLESRVVLSRFGGMGSRAAAKLATAAVARPDSASTTNLTLNGGSAGACDVGLGATRDAQLTAELQTLRTDVNAALAGSSATDAQRLALRTDLQGLAGSGFRFDRATLAPVVDSVLTTLADGTYDSDATVAAANQAAFTALFSANTSVTQTTIDQTYADVVAIARGLNLSTEELSTLATDRAAIAASLARLGITTTNHDPAQTNLDFILSPGFGRGFGSRIGGGFGHRPGRGRS